MKVEEIKVNMRVRFSQNAKDYMGIVAALNKKQEVFIEVEERVERKRREGISYEMRKVYYQVPALFVHKA